MSRLPPDRNTRGFLPDAAKGTPLTAVTLPEPGLRAAHQRQMAGSIATGDLQEALTAMGPRQNSNPLNSLEGAALTRDASVIVGIAQARLTRTLGNF